MNTINFRKTLVEIAEEEEGDGKIAKLIAFYYDNLNLNSRESLFESLLNLYETNDLNFDFNKLSIELSANSEIINTSDYNGKDFRIKEIEISNLRGIPSTVESNNIPFGITLIDERAVISNAIILANNGTGKSSVFAGLEMIFAHEIGEKKLRSKNDVNLKHESYLRRFPALDLPVCRILTNEGYFDLNNKIFSESYLKVFNPVSHFITEFDVIENGRINYNENGFDNSFHNIVARALGLKEYIDFIAIAEQIPNYSRRKESNHKKTIQNEIENNKAIISKRTVEINEKTALLHQLENGNSNAVGNNNKLQLLNNLINKSINISFPSDYVEHLEQFLPIFLEYKSTTKKNRNFSEKNFLEAGKDLLHEFDDCPFCLASKRSKEEVENQLNVRLKNLEQLEIIERKIREGYREVTTTLMTIIQDLKRVYLQFENEQNELSNFPKLDEVRNRESMIYISLAPEINDENLNDFIKLLSQKQFPNEQDYQNLYNLINNNRRLFIERFPLHFEQISALLTLRNNALNLEKESLISTEHYTVEQEISKLKKEITENQQSITTLTKRNEQLEPELIRANKIVENLESIKKEIRTFNIKFNEKKDKIVAAAFFPMKDIIEQIMNDFISEDEKIKLDISLEKHNTTIDQVEYTSELISAKIVDIATGKKTTPDIFFNTFRYKLFCLMISLSIALATRKKYNINLPLVMDDLFFASDYISKNSFAVFFQKIIRLFDKYTPDVPLQFLLFTHDDVIFRSAMDAVYEYHDNSTSLTESEHTLAEKTFICRMFPIEDRAKEPSQFVEGSLFWELLYRLPKKLLIN
jgi:hypothetical protein